MLHLDLEADGRRSTLGRNHHVVVLVIVLLVRASSASSRHIPRHGFGSGGCCENHNRIVDRIVNQSGRRFDAPPLLALLLCLMTHQWHFVGGIVIFIGRRVFGRRDHLLPLRGNDQHRLWASCVSRSDFFQLQLKKIRYFPQSIFKAGIWFPRIVA
jgi:hypothetical protein